MIFNQVGLGGSGGGVSGPFIKCVTMFRNDTLYFGDSWSIGTAMIPTTPGETVHVETLRDYILSSVTREDTGESVPFTTISRTNYTFVMPDADVTYYLEYDD